MPARKREPDRWWRDAEASSASGGHISPTETSGPLFDPLAAAPEQSEDEDASGTGSEPRRERTEVIPHGALRTAADDRSAARRRAKGSRRGSRPAIRRVKRSLRHVDPLSVLKLSLFLYGCLLVLWLVFVAIMYSVLDSVGVFDAVESVWRTAVLSGKLDITLGLVERWAFGVGLALMILGSFVNVFLAFLYNLAADVVGGAELTFMERDY